MPNPHNPDDAEKPICQLCGVIGHEEDECPVIPPSRERRDSEVRVRDSCGND